MTTTDPDDLISGAPDRAGQPRVLVVEDEALVRMVVVDLLESLGFQVDEASTAAEAIGKLQGGAKVAAAIIDLGLPDRRGDALAADIRGQDGALAILIASGYGEDSVDGDLRQDPRSGFLAKPYDMAQLRSSLAALGIEAQA